MAAAQYGIIDPRLEAAKPPKGFEPVWEMFWCELYQGTRLSYSELDAYQRTTGTVLSPMMVKCIMRMDAAAAAYMGERAMAGHKRPAVEVGNGRD